MSSPNDETRKSASAGETVFGYPGLGRYSVNSFLSLDLNSVVGSVTLIAMCYALSNLIVDILYTFLDPRVRY